MDTLHLRLHWDPVAHSVQVGPYDKHTSDVLRLGDDEYNTLLDAVASMYERFLNEAFVVGRSERVIAAWLEAELMKSKSGDRWCVRPVT